MTTIKREPKQIGLFTDRVFEHDVRKGERADLRDKKRQTLDPADPRAAAVALGKRRRHRVGPHR